MEAIKAFIAVLANLIIYYAFGSLFVSKKDSKHEAIMTMAVGFFAYYSLFSVLALPIMLTYRPLSLLTKCWTPFVAVVVIFSIIFKRSQIIEDFSSAKSRFEQNKAAVIIVSAMILIQAICIVFSYDFTLDAAYYVANVTTSVDTNMINVYDPFTGAWQDHYELRYAFATYSINDAVVCQLTKIPALIQTKVVMASTVVILVNLVYAGIADTLFGGDSHKVTIMMAVVMWMNYTFITIYTASNFLMTRTYEGKAIVGNLSLILIFWLFIKLVNKEKYRYYFLMLFAISFGSTSITSSANMLIPAEISVLFVPYIIKHKSFKMIPKYLVLIIPGLVMLMVYVLYVKGYFAVHTYPRY